MTRFTLFGSPHGGYLCAAEPTIADLFSSGDVAFRGLRVRPEPLDECSRLGPKTEVVVEFQAAI
jgi:hypothetical protein